MRAVVTCLLATGVLPKAPAIPPDWEQEGLSCGAFDICNTDWTTDETPIQEELQNPTKESNLTPVIAPVTTRKGKRRMLHHPPTPQESRQTPPTGEMPPPPPVAPTPRTRTRKQKDQGVQMALSRVIDEMVLDGGGHFSPAGIGGTHTLTLLFSSYTAHSRAEGNPI